QEFTLRYAAVFSMQDAAGDEVVPQQIIELSRDYVSLPNNAVGSESEREMLSRELQREMAAAVLRRIDSVNRAREQGPAACAASGGWAVGAGTGAGPGAAGRETGLGRRAGAGLPGGRGGDTARAGGRGRGARGDAKAEPWRAPSLRHRVTRRRLGRPGG